MSSQRVGVDADNINEGMCLLVKIDDSILTNESWVKYNIEVEIEIATSWLEWVEWGQHLMSKRKWFYNFKC